MLEVRGSSVLRPSGSFVSTDVADTVPPVLIPAQRQNPLQSSQSHHTLLKVSSLRLRVSAGPGSALALVSTALAAENATAVNLIPNSVSQRGGGQAVDSGLNSSANSVSETAPNSTSCLGDIWSLSSTNTEPQLLSCTRSQTSHCPDSAVLFLHTAAVSSTGERMDILSTPLILQPPVVASASASEPTSLTPTPQQVIAHSLDHPTTQPCEALQPWLCTPTTFQHQSPNPLLQQQQQQLNWTVSMNSSSCSSTASRGCVSFGSSSWGSCTGSSDFFNSGVGSGGGGESGSGGGGGGSSVGSTSWLSVQGGAIGAGYDLRVPFSTKGATGKAATAMRAFIPKPALSPDGVSAMRLSTGDAPASCGCGGVGVAACKGGTHIHGSLVREDAGPAGVVEVRAGTPPVPLYGLDGQGLGCNNSSYDSDGPRGSIPVNALLEPLISRQDDLSHVKGAAATAVALTEGCAATAAAAVLGFVQGSASTRTSQPGPATPMRHRSMRSPPRASCSSDRACDGGSGDGGVVANMKSPRSREVGMRSVSTRSRGIGADRPLASSGTSEPLSRVLLASSSTASSSSSSSAAAITASVAVAGTQRTGMTTRRALIPGCTGSGSGGAREKRRIAEGVSSGQARGETGARAQGQMTRTATQRSVSNGSPRKSRNARHRSSSKHLLESRDGKSVTAGATTSPRSRSCTPLSSPRARVTSSLSTSYQLQLRVSAKSGTASLPLQAISDTVPGPIYSPGTSLQTYLREISGPGGGSSSGRFSLREAYGSGTPLGGVRAGTARPVAAAPPLQGHTICTGGAALGPTTAPPRPVPPLSVQAIGSGGVDGGSGGAIADTCGRGGDGAGGGGGDGGDGVSEHLLCQTLTVKHTTPSSLLLSLVPCRVVDPSVPPLHPNTSTGSGSSSAAAVEAIGFQASNIFATSRAPVMAAVMTPGTGLRLCLGSAGAAVEHAAASEASAPTGPRRSNSISVHSAPHSPYGSSTAAASMPPGATAGAPWKRSLEPLTCASARYAHDLTSIAAEARSTSGAAGSVGVLGTPPAADLTWSSEERHQQQQYQRQQHQRWRRTGPSCTGDGAAADPSPPARSSPPRLQPLDSVPLLPMPTLPVPKISADGGAGALGFVSGAAAGGLSSLHLKPVYLVPLQSHPPPDLAAGTSGSAVGVAPCTTDHPSRTPVPSHLRNSPSPEYQQQQHHHQNMQDELELGPASRGGSRTGYTAGTTSSFPLAPCSAPLPSCTLSPAALLDWRKPSPPPMPLQSLQQQGGTVHSAAATSSGEGCSETAGHSSAAPLFFISGSAAPLTGPLARKGNGGGGGSSVSPGRRRAQRHAVASPGRLHHTQPLPGSAGSFVGGDAEGGESGGGSSGGAISGRTLGSMTARAPSEHVRKAQERLEAYSRAQKEKARAAETEEAARRQRQAEERNRHVAQRERRRVEVYALNALLARSEAARTQQLIQAMAKVDQEREAQRQRQQQQQQQQQQQGISDSRSLAGGSDSGDGGDSMMDSDTDCEDEGTGHEGGSGRPEELMRGKAGRTAAQAAEFLRHGV